MRVCACACTRVLTRRAGSSELSGGPLWIAALLHRETRAWDGLHEGSAHGWHMFALLFEAMCLFVRDLVDEMARVTRDAPSMPQAELAARLPHVLVPHHLLVALMRDRRMHFLVSAAMLDRRINSPRELALASYGPNGLGRRPVVSTTAPALPLQARYGLEPTRRRVRP